MEFGRTLGSTHVGELERGCTTPSRDPKIFTPTRHFEKFFPGKVTHENLNQQSITNHSDDFFYFAFVCMCMHVCTCWGTHVQVHVEA